jgi:hypothetical protein
MLSSDTGYPHEVPRTAPSTSFDTPDTAKASDRTVWTESNPSPGEQTDLGLSAGPESRLVGNRRRGGAGLIRPFSRFSALGSKAKFSGFGSQLHELVLYGLKTSDERILDHMS